MKFNIHVHTSFAREPANVKRHGRPGLQRTSGADRAASHLPTSWAFKQIATQFGLAAQPLACKMLILKPRRDVSLLEEHAW